MDVASGDEASGLRAVPDDGWWTAQQVADWLGVSVDWVWARVRLRDTGLPFLRMRKQLRFPVAKVKAWAERRVTT